MRHWDGEEGGSGEVEEGKKEGGLKKGESEEGLGEAVNRRIVLEADGGEGEVME